MIAALSQPADNACRMASWSKLREDQLFLAGLGANNDAEAGRDSLFQNFFLMRIMDVHGLNRAPGSAASTVRRCVDSGAPLNTAGTSVWQAA